MIDVLRDYIECWLVYFNRRKSPDGTTIKYSQLQTMKPTIGLTRRLPHQYPVQYLELASLHRYLHSVQT